MMIWFRWRSVWAGSSFTGGRGSGGRPCPHAAVPAKRQAAPSARSHLMRRRGPGTHSMSGLGLMIGLDPRGESLGELDQDPTGPFVGQLARGIQQLGDVADVGFRLL